ncbi:GntR family transcriptional regulator [Gymnodinialimonas ulvae]|uniref:GntR family transcriptional regulator n=1 Tax=Gymnodinialimonas ulvae TaxID=3126504 RepID=UPI00309B9CAA
MPQKSVSSTKRAIHELRARIFSGDLPAGSDHLETELAELLEMSRTPVREAILTLAGQGLLAMRPRKGVRILPLSPDDMAEIYDVLTELEALAAEQAAKARYDEDELKILTRAIDDMDAALACSDLDRWSRADEQFHHELVRLGGNTRVSAIVEMMSDQVRRARNTTLYIRPMPVKSNEDHRAVVEAIRNADAEAARCIHHRHRSDTKEILVALLRKHRVRFL